MLIRWENLLNIVHIYFERWAYIYIFIINMDYTYSKEIFIELNQYILYRIIVLDKYFNIRLK